VVTVEHLHKRFGDLHVLRGVNLEVHKGEVVVVIGPSGSGKSTFLRCINHLEQPTAGEIHIDGINLEDGQVNINEIRQTVGMVFQQFNLFPHLTVLENVTLAPVRVLNMEKKTAERLGRELLGKVGLADKESRILTSFPVDRSRGWRLPGLLQ
jgi:ABC-type polar amino acid transport system ATPase subunit